MFVARHRQPLDDNSSIFKLPEAGELVEEGGPCEAKGVGGARAEKGFSLDVLEQLECIRAERTKLVKDEWDEGAALFTAVGTVLAGFF